MDVQVIPTGVDWITPITSNLRNGTLVEYHNTSQRLKVRSSCFVLIGDVLYKRGFSRSYLRCLIPDKANCHKGVCGNHLRAHSLVHKLIQVRYYWPIM